MIPRSESDGVDTSLLGTCICMKTSSVAPRHDRGDLRWPRGSSLLYVAHFVTVLGRHQCQRPRPPVSQRVDEVETAHDGRGAICAATWKHEDNQVSVQMMLAIGMSMVQGLLSAAGSRRILVEWAPASKLNQRRRCKEWSLDLWMGRRFAERDPDYAV